MVGILRGIGVSILFLLSWSFTSSARADAPVTSYDCAPGTPVKGVGCKCPKAYGGKTYTAARDPADEGKAVCVGSKAASRPVPTPPQNNKYDSLLSQANDAADAFNCSKAEELYQKALAANPKGVEALVGSGNCMAKQSKWTNAHLRFDRALAINSKYEPALWGKAEAYRLAYKKDDAIAAYRQYLDVFPNSYKAKQALEKLTGGAPVVEKIDVRPPRGRIGGRPSRTQDMTITISGTRINANGTEISGTPQLADFEAVYGKPDRVWDTKQGVNRVHTWDDLGMIVYEPLDGRAISVTFPFKSMGMAYDPKTMFGGSITVDGYALTASTDLNAVKARPGATQPYSATSVVIAKGDFNVFTTGRNGPIDLVEISMWKKGNTTSVVGGTRGGKYASTRDVKIVVSGGSVQMNGVSIGGKPYLRDIEAIYGKPDRTWDNGGTTGNRVHTWDKLGIVVYEPRDGRCVSTTFPYKPMGSSYDPSTMFGGTISVDGRLMPSTLDLATVKARPGAGQPYGKDSIVFDKGDIHVFTIAAKGSTLDLVEISYWQRDKKGVGVSTGSTSNTNLAAADVKVEVTSRGTVRLQGTEVGPKPMLADIKKIYGEPSRVWDKKGAANRIHTWDHLGLVVYEPFNGRAVSLTMPYKDMKTDFAPKTLFKGRVSLDGRGFYNFNTIGTIKGRAGATQPYGTDSVVFDFGEVHIFTKAPAATVKTIELVEISFWQKK